MIQSSSKHYIKTDYEEPCKGCECFDENKTECNKQFNCNYNKSNTKCEQIENNKKYSILKIYD